MKRSFEDCRDTTIVLRRHPTTNIPHDRFALNARLSGPQLDLLPGDTIGGGKVEDVSNLLHLPINSC